MRKSVFTKLERWKAAKTKKLENSDFCDVAGLELWNIAWDYFDDLNAQLTKMGSYKNSKFKKMNWVENVLKIF